MLENKTERRCIEPDVVGIQHGAQHGDGQRALKGFWDIGCDERNSVALANAAPGKRGRQTLTALCHLSPVTADIAMNLSGQIGIDPLRAL